MCDCGSHNAVKTPKRTKPTAEYCIKDTDFSRTNILMIVSKTISVLEQITERTGGKLASEIMRVKFMKAVKHPRTK